MYKFGVNFILTGVMAILFFCAAPKAQSVNITGTVLDSLKLMGIYNAKVKLVEYTKCTTRTIAGGNFTLTGIATGILNEELNASEISENNFSLHGNALIMKNIPGSSPIVVDVFGINGSRIYHTEKSTPSSGNITVNNLWSADGVYFIKVKINGNTYRISGFGINEKSGISNFLMSGKGSSAAKKNATYTLEITANGYITKRVSMTGITGSTGTVKLVFPPMANAGTGTNYQASHVTGVSGGGPFPDISTGYTCNCDGTGATDATSCLQNALNTAATLKKPLLIPFTNGFYKISSALRTKTSVIGTGAGMPTIKQVNTGGGDPMSNLKLDATMTGWIYNLHLVGAAALPGFILGSEWAYNILVYASNVTIKGCVLELAKGDCITDNNINGGVTRNVLIDGNTLSTAGRCNWSLTGKPDHWVFINNQVLITVPGWQNFATIDFEGDADVDYISQIEVAYNKFSVGNCRTILLMTLNDKTPGGNIFIHNNYGQVNDRFFYQFPGWTNVILEKNVNGNAIPQ
jgi:hypothetical protein